MKTIYLMEQMRIYLAAMFCLFAVSSCISGGEETVVLETGNAQARKMLLGEWKLSAKTVVDENGNEISKEDISEDPILEFTEDGSCILKYPNGSDVKQDWSLSEDSYFVSISDIHYEIYTLGKNILVLVIKYKDYYLKFVYYKLSSPEQNSEGEGQGEIGGIDDDNPYKPFASENRISKIVVDDTDTYTFEYDAKSRIMRYKTPSKTYAFIYDDTKVYLRFDGKIVNTGFVGNNGYLTKMWNGTDEGRGVSTFTYNSSKNLTKLVYQNGSTNTSWTPTYTYGRLTSLYGDNSHTFGYYGENYNDGSVDLNGFISAIYQWEWFMHDPEVVWGLFDFYGKRSTSLLSTEATAQWNNNYTYYFGERENEPNLKITQVRKGLNSNFTKTYKIYWEVQ